MRGCRTSTPTGTVERWWSPPVWVTMRPRWPGSVSTSSRSICPPPPSNGPVNAIPTPPSTGRSPTCSTLRTEWEAAFDLVVEVFTIQSIPPDRHAEAATATRSFLAPGGTLIGVAIVHDGTMEPEGPPWPLHPSTIDVLVDGLDERSRHVEELGPTASCVRLELVRSET